MENKKFIIGVICAASVVSCSIHEADLQEAGTNPVFYASIEQPSEDDGTRVYVNQDYKVLWDEGDRISIFNKKDANDEYRFTGKTGDNGGSFELVKDFSEEGVTIDHRYAVYPYSQSTSIDIKGTLSVSLPAEQYYREHSFGPGANMMVAATDNKEFQFKNVCGYLVLKLYGEGVSVSSITLKGNSGEKLAGKATITMPLEGVPSVTMADEASTEIILSCETPVQLGATSEASTPFWFVVSPVTFNNGFTIMVNESTGGVFEKSTTKSVTIKRNNVSTMAPVEVKSEDSSIPVPEAIDLGLSVKWASFNLGASKPEEFGDYYAWGEIETYYVDGYAQSSTPVWKAGKENGYDWLSYKWCNGSIQSLTKYNDSESQGVVDNLVTLLPQDDAAFISLASKWRLPSFYEVKELINECSWNWIENNGVRGFQVTSNKKGYEDRSIFIPAAGYRTMRYYDNNSYYGEEYGYIYYGRYWTSTITDYNAPIQLHISEDFDYPGYLVSFGITQDRYQGFTIRPVFGDRVHVKDLTLNTNSIRLKEGEQFFVDVQVFPNNAEDQSYSFSISDPSIISVKNGYYSSVKGLFVDGLSPGKATITVRTHDGDLEARCEVEVREKYPTPDAIDMGLSVKWANFNLGASLPEEFGDFFQWGKTDSISKTHNDPYSVVDDYKSSNKTQLDLLDDAAYVLLGNEWRIPTRDEITELSENCTVKAVSYQGVKGHELTSQVNGNTIFIPLTGSYRGEGVGEEGYYWSSTLTKGNPLCWSCDLYNIIDWWITAGSSGLPIRPVCE